VRCAYITLVNPNRSTNMAIFRTSLNRFPIMFKVLVVSFLF
jgi:hypothetical protein